MNGAWCLVSREYPPHSGGGIGTYAATFSELLARRGVPVVVVTAHADARADEHTNGVDIIRLPLQNDDRWAGPHASITTKEMQDLWHTLGPHSVFSRQVANLVPELLDRFGVGVIEGCDTGAPLWHLLGDRADPKWAADVRVITHVHSPSAWIERLNRRLEQSKTMHELQRMEREQTRGSDAVVTPSHGMEHWLAHRWGVRADVIRYPFELLPESPPGKGGVLFVGRLEFRKGIDTLLRAWPRVETDTRLRIVGADVVDYRTNQSVSEGLLSGLDRVELLGTLPPDRIAELQRDASVVVVPSPDDNFPFTCIEAMAAGRVVVAANAGGAAEMIEHGLSGLLFEPYDEQGLADTLTRSLDMGPDERAAMGQAARERIGSLCDPQCVLDERVEQVRKPPAPVITSPGDSSEHPLLLRQPLATTSAPREPLWRRAARRLLGG